MQPILSKCRAVLTVFLLAVLPETSTATDCSKWQEFRSSNPSLKPQAVSVSNIQDHINGIETSEGVILDIELKQTELWIDVVYVPDEASAISGLRAVMQIGRLVADEFDSIVLADNGQGVYQVPEPKLREIGCQFIWGEEGGQNSIYLIRIFFESLEEYPSGEKSVVGFTGSLLGDTSYAMQYHNEVFLQRWLLSALE